MPAAHLSWAPLVVYSLYSLHIFWGFTHLRFLKHPSQTQLRDWVTARLQVLSMHLWSTLFTLERNSHVTVTISSTRDTRGKNYEIAIYIHMAQFQVFLWSPPLNHALSFFRFRKYWGELRSSIHAWIEISVHTTPYAMHPTSTPPSFDSTLRLHPHHTQCSNMYICLQHTRARCHTLFTFRKLLKW